jgi:hypothetical protein
MSVTILRDKPSF